MAKVIFRKYQIKAQVNKNISKAFDVIGKKMVRRVRSSMKPGSGFTYLRVDPGGRVRTHRASSPGEPPAPDTVRLKDSITYASSLGQKSTVGSRAFPNDGIKQPSSKVGEMVLAWGSDVPYSIDLELGLGEGLAPRPFLSRSLVDGMKDIEEAFDF